MVKYIVRPAIAGDHDLIYTLKAESIRPYVEKIWGWDEKFQQKDFDSDFASVEYFSVIEIDGKFIGFLQCYFESPYLYVAEIHLLSEYRGKGIGSDILLSLQNNCLIKKRTMRIGCFKENHRAKSLYQKLGFIQTEETNTHYILQYPY